MNLQKILLLSTAVVVGILALPEISEADNASQCMKKQASFEKNLKSLGAIENHDGLQTAHYMNLFKALEREYKGFKTSCSKGVKGYKFPAYNDAALRTGETIHVLPR